MTMGQREKWEKERLELKAKTDKRLIELVDKEEVLMAVEIVLNIHYVLGDMNAQEALDEICHLVYPDSRPLESTAKRDEK